MRTNSSVSKAAASKSTHLPDARGRIGWPFHTKSFSPRMQSCAGAGAKQGGSSGPPKEAQGQEGQHRTPRWQQRPHQDAQPRVRTIPFHSCAILLQMTLMRNTATDDKATGSSTDILTESTVHLSAARLMYGNLIGCGEEFQAGLAPVGAPFSQHVLYADWQKAHPTHMVTALIGSHAWSPILAAIQTWEASGSRWSAGLVTVGLGLRVTGDHGGCSQAGPAGPACAPALERLAAATTPPSQCLTLSTAVVSFLLALPPPSAAAASALAVTSCHLPLLLQDAKPASRRRRQRRAEVLHQVPQPEGPRRLLEEQVRVPSVRGHHSSDAPQSSGQPDDHLALVTPFVRSMLAAVGCRIWAGVSHSAPGPST